MKRQLISRRGFFRRAALGATALAAVGAPAFADSSPSARPYGPFKMGIQSYSLRGYGFDQALEQTMALGLTYWEGFSSHIPENTSPETVADVKDKLHIAGIRMPNYGVVGFGADKDANRKMFEFAHDMGIKVLSADPDPASFDQLDELVDEFRIRIAIHNHGPGSRYSTLQNVTDAIKGRHIRIGACVDTGHYMRSGVDPVEAVQTIGRRVFDVHLKDVKNQNQFTVLGQGDLKLVELLKLLHGMNYQGLTALEYEDKPENPIADIQASLVAMQAAVKKI
ncbi:MAG TPA: sugar phosphate isomerase/epimerase [Armatimonadota bacterium]|nr:sugar phosphate isomerase/epimerase [Armatimonadota bacterium]